MDRKKEIAIVKQLGEEIGYGNLMDIYDDFIISEKLWNDIADLISIRAKEGKGISADEVRVIYDMHINYIDLKEKKLNK